MTADWTLPLPWRRPPLNLNQRHAHWAVENKLKQEIKTETAKVARALRVPTLQGVIAELVYYPGNNRVMDSDNIAPTMKAVLDGLRVAHVLPDDDASRVLRTSQRIVLRRDDPYDGKTGRMYLHLLDASALAPTLPHFAPTETACASH